MVQDHPWRYKHCSFEAPGDLRDYQMTQFCISTGIIKPIAEKLEDYAVIFLKTKLAPFLINHGISTWAVFYRGKAPMIAMGVQKWHDRYRINTHWSLGTKSVWKTTPDGAPINSELKCDFKEDKQHLEIDINIADPDITTKVIPELTPVFAGIRTSKYRVLSGFMWLP